MITSMKAGLSLRALTAAAATVFGLSLVGAANPAQASVVLPFTFDSVNSSVDVTQTGSGFVCNLTSCGVSASISETPASMNIGTGDAWTFDFIDWSTNGTGAGTFDVSATLAFDPPSGTSVGGSGNGGFVTLAGLLTGGVLIWNDMPKAFSVGPSTFTANFEGGVDVFAGSATTTATVTGVNVIPLPAAGWLLLGGLGALGFAARRKRKMAA